MQMTMDRNFNMHDHLFVTRQQQHLMLVGRKFWKSSLFEFEKPYISLLSSKLVIWLMDLMARSHAFPLRCFLAYWIARKWSSLCCIWLFSLSRCASTFVISCLGNSTERAFGTLNPCHLQYASNSHCFSYIFDHDCSSVVASMVVLFGLSCLGSLTMMCPMLLRRSYIYIGALIKSPFLSTYVSP